MARRHGVKGNGLPDPAGQRVPSAKAEGSLDRLTRRKREVALLVGQGNCNKEIAIKLDISPRTVKAHLSSIKARQVASYLMRKYSLLTLREVGKQVGLHYSTVGNVVREISGSKDRRLLELLKDIAVEIKNP